MEYINYPGLILGRFYQNAPIMESINILININGDNGRSLCTCSGNRMVHSDLSGFLKSVSESRNKADINAKLIYYGKQDKKVAELIESCEKTGINTSLVIPPHKLTIEFIDTLVMSGLKKIIFPLPSINPHTYDSFSSEKGSFEKFWSVLDYISDKYENNLNICFICPVAQKNLEEIPPTLGWVINFNMAKIDFLSLHCHLADNGRLNAEYAAMLPKDAEELSKVISYLKEMKGFFPSIFLNSEAELGDILGGNVNPAPMGSWNNKKLFICQHGNIFNSNFESGGRLGQSSSDNLLSKLIISKR